MLRFARIRETYLFATVPLPYCASACTGSHHGIVHSPSLCWQGGAVAGMRRIVHNWLINGESVLLMHLGLVLSQRAWRFLPLNERECTYIGVPGYRLCTKMGRERVVLPAVNLVVINRRVAAIQIGKSLLA